MEAVDFKQRMAADGVSFEFFNAGHVLGAAMVLLEIAGVRILYTGDYRRVRGPRSRDLRSLGTGWRRRWLNRTVERLVNGLNGRRSPLPDSPPLLMSAFANRSLVG